MKNDILLVPNMFSIPIFKHIFSNLPLDYKEKRPGDNDLSSLKKVGKPTQQRLRFDLEKLRDPDVACTVQASIGGKVALIGFKDDDMDIKSCTRRTSISTKSVPCLHRFQLGMA